MKHRRWWHCETNHSRWRDCTADDGTSRGFDSTDCGRVGYGWWGAGGDRWWHCLADDSSSRGFASTDRVGVGHP
jgi:hypothetical protein